LLHIDHEYAIRTSNSTGVFSNTVSDQSPSQSERYYSVGEVVGFFVVEELGGVVAVVGASVGGAASAHFSKQRDGQFL